MKCVYSYITLIVISLFMVSCENESTSLTDNKLNEPTNSLTDCGNDNTVVYFDTLNGVIYTVLTAQEVQELLVNHGLYPVCSETDAKYCKWSDGVGGETDCTGGNCKVISTQNPDYTTSICQGCYINGQLHHAGACRLRP